MVPGVSVDRWNREIEEHVDYLRCAIKDLPGVDNGGIYRDRHGDVIDRAGRFSLNPLWYQEFYRSFRRRPNKDDLYRLAHQHLQYGYWDIGGFIPPLILRIQEEERHGLK